MKNKKITHWVLPLIIVATQANGFESHQLISPATIHNHIEEFSLTIEQIDKLKSIREKAEEGFRPLEEAVRREEQAVDAILQSELIAPDEAKVKFTALLKAEQAAKQQQFTTYLALREVLTPDQLARAVILARGDRESRVPLEVRVQGKAERLKAAFDELGIKPPSGLRARGEAIMELIRVGQLEEADLALDELAKDVGLDEPNDATVIDFSLVDPGATDSETLKDRLDAVQSAAEQVTSLPMLRRLVQARDAMEKAKATEDADLAGRILTWGEQTLGLSSSR
jgi:Spy/CpxP family protein refolding chaperone